MSSSGCAIEASLAAPAPIPRVSVASMSDDRNRFTSFVTSNQAIDVISLQERIEALEDSLAALLSVRMRRRASEGDRDFADVGSQRVEVKVAGDTDALIVSAVPSSAFSASGTRSWALRGGIQGVGDRESAGAPERGLRIGCGRECLSPRSRPCLDHGIRLAPRRQPDHGRGCGLQFTSPQRARDTCVSRRLAR